MMTTEEVGCLRSDVGRQKAEVGKEQGRDTRMCGDPKTWFPMRVTYQREMKVKAELDRLGIENFVPMRYRIVELRRETNTNLTDGTNMRDHGDERWLRADVRGLKSDGRSKNKLKLLI